MSSPRLFYPAGIPFNDYPDNGLLKATCTYNQMVVYLEWRTRMRMGSFVCCYFESGGGRIPVKEFIDSLDFRTQQKFFAVVGLLEEFGKRLPLPHAKYLGDEIFELRFFGQEGRVRVLYFFVDGQRIIFTNGFIKKTGKIPEYQKELAVHRRFWYFQNKGR